MKFKTNFPKGALMPMVLLFFTSLIFTNCKKDNDGGFTDAGNGTISMKIDGVDWQSKDAVNGAVILESLNSLSIQGFADDDSQIGFSLVAPGSASTWNFDTGGAFSYKLNTSDPGWTYLPGQGDTGTITFTTYNDSKAKGTFEGTLTKFDSMGNAEKIIISDGKFDLNF